MNIIAVGVLFLGGFVGFVIGVIWGRVAKPGLKMGVAIIGAALTGAPIAFMTGVGAEKWMYPVGIVCGIFWSYFKVILSAADRSSGASNRRAARAGVYLVPGVTAALILFALFQENSQPPGDGVGARSDISIKELPCRLAWVYLGRFSHGDNKYVIPPAFRYSDRDAMAGPIPSVGAIIEITESRNLLVSDFPTSKCDKMLDPPVGYRPETASNYIAGHIQPGKTVLISDMAFLPNASAEPTYIWALVGAPKGR